MTMLSLRTCAHPCRTSLPSRATCRLLGIGLVALSQTCDAEARLAVLLFFCSNPYDDVYTFRYFQVRSGGRGFS